MDDGISKVPCLLLPKVLKGAFNFRIVHHYKTMICKLKHSQGIYHHHYKVEPLLLNESISKEEWSGNLDKEFEIKQLNN
jgi:hypothetical protein